MINLKILKKEMQKGKNLLRVTLLPKIAHFAYLKSGISDFKCRYADALCSQLYS